MDDCKSQTSLCWGLEFRSGGRVLLPQGTSAFFLKAFNWLCKDGTPHYLGWSALLKIHWSKFLSHLRIPLWHYLDGFYQTAGCYHVIKLTHKINQCYTIIHGPIYYFIYVSFVSHLVIHMAQFEKSWNVKMIFYLWRDHFSWMIPWQSLSLLQSQGLGGVILSVGLFNLFYLFSENDVVVLCLGI